MEKTILERCSMVLVYLALFSYTYPKNDPNVGKNSIHGAYAFVFSQYEHHPG